MNNFITFINKLSILFVTMYSLIIIHIKTAPSEIDFSIIMKKPKNPGETIDFINILSQE